MADQPGWHAQQPVAQGGKVGSAASVAVVEAGEWPAARGRRQWVE
ncbi:hypothetical protein ABZU25_28875 [Micromonospora sp. NPDC005215]